MGTSKLFSKNKLNSVKGAIISVGSINEWTQITKTMSLKDLVVLKSKTVEELKKLLSKLAGMKETDAENIKETLKKIEAYQYNLTIFKQLNAIANVGNPAEDMYGINACIFQSNDLSVLNRNLAMIVIKKNLYLKDFLQDKIRDNKQIINNLHRIQSDYNRKISVTVKYLDIK